MSFLCMITLGNAAQKPYETILGRSAYAVNHVENIWDTVEKRIRARKNPLTTLASLTPVVIEEWEATPQKEIQHLISGMSRRLQELIQED